MKPELALQNLINVAEQALLNGPDRRNITVSIETLAKLVSEVNSKLAEAAKNQSVPKPE
jgi:hypothetical protein